MTEVRGVFLPDDDPHFEEMVRDSPSRRGRGTYQDVKYGRALPLVHEHRVAVDVGSHVGLWAMQFLRDFTHTICFEPQGELLPIWRQNMIAASQRFTSTVPRFHIGREAGACCAVFEEPGRDGHTVRCYHAALGSPLETTPPAQIGLKRYGERSSGNVRVCAPADAADPTLGLAPLMSLDHYDLQTLDLLKIDCEGYELLVLHGARRTLERTKPVVIVEQKPGVASAFGFADTAAIALLETLGACVKWNHGGDYCLSWD